MKVKGTSFCAKICAKLFEESLFVVLCIAGISHMVIGINEENPAHRYQDSLGITIYAILIVLAAILYFAFTW